MICLMIVGCASYCFAIPSVSARAISRSDTERLVFAGRRVYPRIYSVKVDKDWARCRRSAAKSPHAIPGILIRSDGASYWNADAHTEIPASLCASGRTRPASSPGQMDPSAFASRRENEIGGSIGSINPLASRSIGRHDVCISNDPRDILKQGTRELLRLICSVRKNLDFWKDKKKTAPLVPFPCTLCCAKSVIRVSPIYVYVRIIRSKRCEEFGFFIFL